MFPNFNEETKSKILNVVLDNGTDYGFLTFDNVTANPFFITKKDNAVDICFSERYSLTHLLSREFAEKLGINTNRVPVYYYNIENYSVRFSGYKKIR